MFALKEKETIEKMCQELGDVIENFDRAVQLGSHLSVKKIGKCPLSQPNDHYVSLVSCRGIAIVWTVHISPG